MINETGNTENTSFTDEAITSSGEANGQSRVSQFKDIGIKSLNPLLDVITRHKGDLSPYIEAVSKALRAGADSLQGENAQDAERSVAQYFTEGADLVSQWRDKLQVSSRDEFVSLVEEEGRKRPALLFGVSYVAGLVLGRLGRHVGSNVRQSTDSIH